MSRIVGYPELLGRVLDVVNGVEDTVYRPPSAGAGSVYFWDEQPSCVHGHVLAGLGFAPRHGEVSDGDSAGEVYAALGLELTRRARLLAQISQGTQDSGQPWNVCVRMGQRRALRVGQAAGDRRVGDVTVAATIAHVAKSCGLRLRTAGCVQGEAHPWLVDQGVPVSLVGHACALWGITPQQWDGHEKSWAVDALSSIGWHISARASSLLVSAQEAERAGHTWGEIARMLATLNVTAEVAEEVDR